jgi:hypothetical protein
MNETDLYPAIPETVRAALVGRSHLTMPEFSRATRMDPKTIMKHINAGNLSWRHIGIGECRIRRGFTAADIEDFYRRIKRGSAPSLTIKSQRFGRGRMTIRRRSASRIYDA